MAQLFVRYFQRLSQTDDTLFLDTLDAMFRQGDGFGPYSIVLSQSEVSASARKFGAAPLVSSFASFSLSFVFFSSFSSLRVFVVQRLYYSYISDMCLRYSQRKQTQENLGAIASSQCSRSAYPDRARCAAQCVCGSVSVRTPTRSRLPTS